MLYYIKLDYKETNALRNMVEHSTLKNIALETNVNYGDYFYDYNEQRMIPFSIGLKRVVTEGEIVFSNLPERERNLIEKVYTTYCDYIEIRNYVCELNRIIKKGEMKNEF